jgi:hypothetical protein
MPFLRTVACLAVSFAILGGPVYAQKDSKVEAKAKTSDEKDPNAKPLIPKNAAVDATVWGAVIYATAKAKSENADSKPPEEIPDLSQRLAKIKQFGAYKDFELIGQHTQKIFSEYTNWVVPSKELFLNVDSKGPAADGGVNLHVQLWRRTKVLVKTDTTLKKGSPLIIGGPKWREGQLIFVLLLK